MYVFILTAFCIEIPARISVDPVQTPRFAASELCQHCLHMSPKKVSSLKKG